MVIYEDLYVSSDEPLYCTCVVYIAISRDCVIVSLCCRYGYAPYQVFKRMGVPGPTPLPVLGNLPAMLMSVRG